MKKTVVAITFIMISLIAGCAAIPRYFLPDYALPDPVLPDYILPDYILPDADDLPGPDVKDEVDIEEPLEIKIVPEVVPEAVIDSRPMVALTFDDGPGEYTDFILDILERYGGRVTFFVLGYLLEEWEDTVRRAAKGGNEIANHTWVHHRMTLLSDQDVIETIRTTSAAIGQITGLPPSSFFRPPFGLVDRRVADIAAELGYAIVNWTVDTLDWLHRNSDHVYNVVMNSAREGSIILLHDIHATTAAAMERVIPGLIARGFQLVTVSELLAHRHGGHQPGRLFGNPGIAP